MGPSQTSWRGFGVKSLTSCPRTTEGQESQNCTLGEGATPLPSVLTPACVPHGTLARPGHTPPVCTQGGPGTETCGHSNLNCRLRCQPDRSPEKGWRQLGTKVPSGQEVYSIGGGSPPSPGPTGIDTFGSSFFPHSLGPERVEEGLGQMWEGTAPTLSRGAERGEGQGLGCESH